MVKLTARQLKPALCVSRNEFSFDGPATAEECVVTNLFPCAVPYFVRTDSLRHLSVLLLPGTTAEGVPASVCIFPDHGNLVFPCCTLFTRSIPQCSA